MILFFSATGNSKYIAARIAQSDKQRVISIVDCVKNNSYTFEDQVIGIVSPTYFWGLPSIVKAFLEKACFKTEYLYFVATYGTTPGAIGYMANQAIRNREIDAYYSVRMVDTWTPVFDLSTPQKVEKFTKTTETEIKNVIQRISKREKNKKMSLNKLYPLSRTF